MPEGAFKSRPVYRQLRSHRGLRHLLVADADGAAGILDLADKTPPGFFDRAHILYVARVEGYEGYAERLAKLNPDAIYWAPTFAAMLPRLRQMLATSHMGTRLYLAGMEGLIGQATLLATEAGMDLGSIEAEHRGSLARRVQCVHCKGVTEDVTTQPVDCGHCGLKLLVREHYSRRIAAFQGVCIDAEEPGVAPAVKQAFA